MGGESEDCHAQDNCHFFCQGFKSSKHATALLKNDKRKQWMNERLISC